MARVSSQMETITIPSTRTKPRHKRTMTSKEQEDAMMQEMCHCPCVKLAINSP